MAKTRRTRSRREGKGGVKSADYRHTGEKRTNIPPASIAAEGKVPRVPKVRYQYSPHLPPKLRFDPSGKADQLPKLIAEAGRRPLTEKEQKQLFEALRAHEPWLEWAGKEEQQKQGFFKVDPVALHIHERVSTQAILRTLAREDAQRDLFADPQQPYTQAVQFYRHSVDWANRLVLGDSLQVMTSLAQRENLAAKVQMIFFDPPYGISFRSNFQPALMQREVKDRDEDLTREPEMVKAYRDTWTLGVHSYLTYLRQRLLAARALLSSSGSLFIQISDEHVHRVRCVLEEVFGPENYVASIAWKKASPESKHLKRTFNYLLWAARDKKTLKSRKTFRPRQVNEGSTEDPRKLALWALLPDGGTRTLSTDEKRNPSSLPEGARVFRIQDIETPGLSGNRQPLVFEGTSFLPKPGKSWRGGPEEMERLVRAGRVHRTADGLGYRFFVVEDSPVVEFTSHWQDTAGNIPDMIYAVQTNSKIIERCMLMTTDPGDLVLDPTCGGGTTAHVAEQWGRRWITTDTSRVAVALARQRLLTARFFYYALRPIEQDDASRNPKGPWLTDVTGKIDGPATLDLRRVPHITLKDIARNETVDRIVEKHEAPIASTLRTLNSALEHVSEDIRKRLAAKLSEKQRQSGKKAVSEADRRRWDLPKTGWREWEVPFDSDHDWPGSLTEALQDFRIAWNARLKEIDATVATGANPTELVDDPVVVEGVVRVTGPFSVEGVRPEELSLGDDGLFDPTPNEFEPISNSLAAEASNRNVQSYLAQMLQHLRSDGVTFLGNQRKRFDRLEGLFEDASGSLIHAEGAWENTGAEGINSVAISFGPQHGPVTALQIEEAIRAAKQYDELVIAGFSFDAEAYAVVEAQDHPKLGIHIAQIRPDLNEAMAGLLKDTPNSQLFTVFGQPEIEVEESKDGWVCKLNGVCIYDPLENTVRGANADKVAAWFLDSDFDGRCFCITQAFFPDQNAWAKIAKALGSSADPEAFAALKGTISLPFPKGKFSRIAVKVIDPRGNEVMAVRKLG